MSTAGGYHCHYPCDCYASDYPEQADFLAEHDVYRRIERADGFAVFAPIHWYSVPTPVKAMFDRFVCVSQALSVENAARLLDGDVKNPERTRALSASGEHYELLANHWQGKHAAFFVHGDAGADDYSQNRRPKSLRMYAEQEEALTQNPRDAVMPIVTQCRYSGILVPDELVVGLNFNVGLSYAEANDAFRRKKDVFQQAARLLRGLTRAIQRSK